MNIPRLNGDLCWYRPRSGYRQEEDGRWVKMAQSDWTGGQFLSFAQDYEELQDGVGSYPCALVETASGRIEIVSLSDISFAVPKPVDP